MADALSMSMGGRVANIYKQNTKRRRFTTVINEIENKRLTFLKRQIENDRDVEHHKLERSNNQMTNSNDELKAFQIALLRRIKSVREQSKFREETRPLLNLGRYGGATVEQVKAESEKYKRIRDPAKRRKLKARIQLEQGKRDGRIRELSPKHAGNLAEDILQLYKIEEHKPVNRLSKSHHDVANLDDVRDVTGHNYGSYATPDQLSASYPPTQQPRRLVLPPLQIKRSLHPNSNYYRKISADYHQREQEALASRRIRSPIHRRISLLENITEKGDKNENEPGVREVDGGIRDHSAVKNCHSTQQCSPLEPVSFESFPVTSMRRFDSKEPEQRTKTDKYVWNHSETMKPVKIRKQLSESQKFWRQTDSLSIKSKPRVLLTKIE